MEPTGDFPIKFHLRGRFRVETASGRELTPLATKSQAILALIATEPKLTRTRSWIQDKLWSRSDATHGAGSLRTELVQIRRALGPAGSALHSNRLALSLDHNVVEIIETGSAELLEGLDVKDPEFDNWLSCLRAADPAAEPIAPSAEMVPVNVLGRAPRPHKEIVIIPHNTGEELLGRIETRFAEIICKNLSEMFVFATRIGEQDDASEGTIRLSVEAIENDTDELGLRVAVDRKGTSFPPWAEMAFGSWPDKNLNFRSDHLGLCYRSIDTLGHLLVRSTHATHHSAVTSDEMLSQALTKMFSMSPEEFDAADRLLHDAYELEGRGLYLAWRAQLAVIRAVETPDADLQESLDVCQELCAKAMSDEPTNSHVLAAVANARLMIENDVAAAGELSRLAVVSNSANPFAWSSWTDALLFTGEFEKAHAAARTGQLLAQGGRFRFWADFGVALTATGIGNLETAIRNAELTRALSPRFRPPLRYLIGLNASAGNMEAARKHLGRLRKLEPDFSVDRMINDETYPVSFLRRGGFMDPDRLRDL